MSDIKTEQTSTTPEERVTATPALIGELLNVIKDGESYGNESVLGVEITDPYNVRHGSRSNTGITDKTLQEVYDLLEEDGKASGAYQITKDTMEWLVKWSGMEDVDWEDTFSPEMQDRMAVRLAQRRGIDKYLNGEITKEELAGNLSKEWAALPKDSGGETYWDQTKMLLENLTGANAANIGWEELLTAIPDRITPAIAKTIKLGDLNIEDYDPKPSVAAQPLDIPYVDFEEANRQGMLSSLGVDEPQRERVVVPQPRLDGANFGIEDRLERKRQGMMASLGVDIPATDTAPVSIGREPAVSQLARQTQDRYAVPDTSFTPPPPVQLEEIIPTQRGQVPIPQKRQPPPAPTAPLRPESQPNIEAMLASQQDQAMNPVVRPPEPVPEPILEEIVPTQRGQVPIPQRPPVEPERVVGLEPRLESELAANQMSAMELSQIPMPTDEQVKSGSMDSEPRLESELASQMLDVPVKPVSELESKEPAEPASPEPELILEPDPPRVDLDPLPPALESVEYAPVTQDKSYERKEQPQVKTDMLSQVKSTLPEAPSMEDSLRQSLPDVEVPEDYKVFTGRDRRAQRSLDTIAMAGSLYTYDEVAGFLGQAFGDTPYEETVNRIRQNVADQRAVRPGLALAQELGAGLLTGGGVANQLVKRGMSYGKAGFAEGVGTGVAMGENLDERLGGGLALGALGGSLGGAIGWATRKSTDPNRSTVEGGRTSADDVLDDQIQLDTFAESATKGVTAQYRTNKGDLKTVKVIAVLDNGLVQIRDGKNIYAVSADRLEKMNVGTGDETIMGYKIGRTPEGAMKDAEKVGQFVNPEQPSMARSKPALGEYDIYKQGEHYYTLDVETQLKLLADDVADETVPSIDASARRFSYIDERPYTKGRKADKEETNWRDATNAGEFFDGVKDLIKRFYNNNLVGASDYLMKISPEVGARFQRFTETALRNNTISFENVMVPIEKVVKGLEKDKQLKAMMLDYTNTANLARRNAELGETNTLTTEGQLLKYIADNYDSDQAGAFARYLGWNKMMKKRHAQYINGERQYQNSDIAHIHSQLTAEKKAEKFKSKTREFRDNFEATDDSAKEFRSRLSMVDDLNNNGSAVDDYLNPLLTDFRRTANYENLNQMARVFSLPETVVEQQPARMFDTLRRTFVEKGMSPKDAKYMSDRIKDDFIGQSRSPSNWIQFLNSWGYAGSLAGPKSALLNLHDIPMAAVLYGPSSFRGIFKEMGYDVGEKGIRQNVGEFMNYMQEQLNSGPASLSKQLADTSRKGTDMLMRASGFAWFDQIGKKGITKMIIQDAVDNVDNLKDRWGFYFSGRELNLIQKQLKKHGTNVGAMRGEGAKLFEELFFAGLGQQQLISSAGRPLAWSRNPNFRFMWALRGFAIKQLALAQRNIFDNIAKGNKQAAWDYMKRYALFSAGSFGLMNETRQWLWGDGNFTAGGVVMGFADQIVSTASINTIGLNDYQWGKMMEDGILITTLRAGVPITFDIPLDTIGDVIDAIDEPDKGWQTPITNLPLIDQWSNFVNNAEEDSGLVPNPMARFSRQFIQQEKAE
jgi:hypothetical protein